MCRSSLGENSTHSTHQNPRQAQDSAVEQFFVLNDARFLPHRFSLAALNRIDDHCSRVQLSYVGDTPNAA